MQSTDYNDETFNDIEIPHTVIKYLNPAKPSVMYALQYNEKKKVRYSKYNTFIYQQTDQRLKVLIILRTREVHAELQHMPEEEA